ncbi:hypothetical protein A9P82_08785 [Arachidicoccus ginsenosidimutans]|nr:hypothetical protein A9P82_08785 [Arachidicoccus sp. BS20]
MSVSDARAWFQNEYSGNIADVKSIAGSDKTRLVSYARGVFAGEPDWNYHHQYRHSSNALMIPLDYADTSTKYRGFRDVVVVRNKARKTFNAYVQLEIFKKSYLDSLIKAKGNLPDIRSYSEPATFTGEVLLFSINNEFIRGAVYKNGKRVARIFPKNGIGSMVQGIANSLHSAETYVRFSGGANLAAMTKEGDSKKVALNTTAPTPSYEEAAVHTATSSSGTGDTDSDGDSIWDGTDLGEVSVTSDPTDSNPSGIGWGNDPGDSYPTGNDPTPSDPSSGGGGGGGTSTPPPQPDDPCAAAKAGSQNATNISKTAGYSGGLSAVDNAASDGQEHSVALNKGSNGSITASSVSSGGETNTTTGINSNTVATIHNHPNGVPPSAGDVYGLISGNKEFTSFSTKYVTLPNGTVYALVITNPTAASSFFTNYPESQISGYPPDFPDALADKFNDIYQTAKDQGNQMADEMALSYILDNYNAGVALLKVDANGNFNKLNTNTSTSSDGSTTYSQTNCN